MAVRIQVRAILDGWSGRDKKGEVPRKVGRCGGEEEEEGGKRGGKALLRKGEIRRSLWRGERQHRIEATTADDDGRRGE